MRDDEALAGAIDENGGEPGRPPGSARTCVDIHGIARDVLQEEAAGQIVPDPRPERDVSAEARDRDGRDGGHAGRVLDDPFGQDLATSRGDGLDPHDGVPEGAADADDAAIRLHTVPSTITSISFAPGRRRRPAACRPARLAP